LDGGEIPRDRCSGEEKTLKNEERRGRIRDDQIQQGSLTKRGSLDIQQIGLCEKGVEREGNHWGEGEWTPVLNTGRGCDTSHQPWRTGHMTSFKSLREKKEGRKGFVVRRYCLGYLAVRRSLPHTVADQKLKKGSLSQRGLGSERRRGGLLKEKRKKDWDLIFGPE